MTKTTIYFIRHAESPFIFGEERERPLSEKGHNDSIKVANILSDVTFDQYISSSYIRAVQTLEPLAKDKEIITYENLREKTLKGPYKLDKEKIEDTIKNSFIDLDFKLDGGESTRQAQQRAVPIIKEMLNNPDIKIVAVGTHGNILTSILNYFDSTVGFDFWKASSKPDIYKVEFENEHIQTINRIGFEN